MTTVETVQFVEKLKCKISVMRGFIFFPVFLFVFFVLPAGLSAQSGCTDPQALNFLPAATTNDGSCIYGVTSYAPPVLATLPEELREISGLADAGDRWWGHNDGGYPPVLYRLLPETGSILQTITLQNAANQDWEDLTTDETHLYIGDFGNNFNDRQDLGIYRLPLAAIGPNPTETVPASAWTFLPFTYADQTDFSTQPEDSTEHDCEAMVFLNGSLHVFTKNWKQRMTTHHVVNTDTEQAEPLEVLDTQGLITGASVSPDGKVVVLLGYDLVGFPKMFCWLLWDWHDGLLFNGNKRRIELGNVFTLGQAEAFAFGTNRSGFLANERVVLNGVSITPPRTYAFDVGAWIPEAVVTHEPEATAGRIFPNPFAESVQLPNYGTDHPALRVCNARGQVVLETAHSPGTLVTSHWPPGWYTFAWRGPTSAVIISGWKQ